MLWGKLEIDPRTLDVVTLVGAGGKTTLLYALAAEAAHLGLRVCITTTTKMYPHHGLPKGGVFQMGTALPDGKIGPVSTIALCRKNADLVLVEGDGASGHPLKAPEEWEPVIPPESGLVICVAGLSAIREPIEHCCHRADRVGALLGKSPDRPVTAADVAAILASPLGGRKGVPLGAAYRCVLNQADDAGRQALGRDVTERLGLEGILAVMTAFTERERGAGCWF